MSIDVSNTPDMYTITISGTFTFNTNCRVRNTPDMSDGGVATYTSGMTVTYDSKLKNGDHLWLSYIADSGTRRYIPYANTDTGVYFGTDSNPVDPVQAATSSTPTQSSSNDSGLGTLSGQAGADVADQTPDGTTLTMSGSFTFNTTARGWDNDLMSANKGDTFNSGDTVYYDAKIKNDGHYWFEYSHYGSGTYYVPYTTISPFHVYGTDDNPGDPVYAQDQISTTTTTTTSTSDTSSTVRDHTGQDTGLQELTSDDARTQVGEGYVYPCRGSLVLKSNAMGRTNPNMAADEIKKYLAGNKIPYTGREFANGHLWVVVNDNGTNLYLPVSTIANYESSYNYDKKHYTSTYSYVLTDYNATQPFSELWPNTATTNFFDVDDTSSSEVGSNITNISATTELTPSSDELNAMQQLADEVNASADDQSVSIAYITDTHFDSYKTPGTARVLHSMQLMSYFAKNFGVDLVIHGGDLNDGVKPKDISEADIKRAVDAIKFSQRPYIILQGNHDDNSGYSRDESGLDASQIITNEEALSLRRNWFSNWLDIPDNNPNNAVYGSYQVPNSNVTIIVLDGFDQADASNPTREMVRHGHTEYSTAQQNWLQSTLDSITDDQKVIIFDHISLSGVPLNQWAYQEDG